MKKLILNLQLIAVAICFSNIALAGSVAANVTLKMNSVAKNATSNSISTNFSLKNEGTTAIDLKDVVIRYYYTNEDKKAQSFWCDNAAITGSGQYSSITNKVNGSFTLLATPATNADSYLEISFKNNTGSLLLRNLNALSYRYSFDRFFVDEQRGD
jgi:hypothetical protein